MQVTADFMTEGEGLADNYSFSLEKRPHDYAQGYGLVNVERAVGLALTLEELRKDRPETTVHEALESYLNIINDTTKKEDTDVLVASWDGEYSLHNDQNDVPMYTTSQIRYVFISNESEKLIVDLSFPPIDLEDNTVGSVAVTLDYDDDQNVDWSGEVFDENTLDGQRHDEIDISGGEFASHKGKLWAFSIYGYAVSTLRDPRNPTIPVVRSFRAPTIEYSTSVQQVLDMQGSDNIFVDYRDFRSIVVQLGFGEPTQDYMGNGSIEMASYFYDLSKVYQEESPPPRKSQDAGFLWWIILILAVLMGLLGYFIFQKKKTQENGTFTPVEVVQPQQPQITGEIVEAEVISQPVQPIPVEDVERE
jgi:hypothetical protein